MPPATFDLAHQPPWGHKAPADRFVDDGDQLVWWQVTRDVSKDAQRIGARYSVSHDGPSGVEVPAAVDGCATQPGPN